MDYFSMSSPLYQQLLRMRMLYSMVKSFPVGIDLEGLNQAGAPRSCLS
jgi:hypothetical protein